MIYLGFPVYFHRIIGVEPGLSHGVISAASQTWQRLASTALELLDIELALRIYRQLGDAAMVRTHATPFLIFGYGSYAGWCGLPRGGGLIEQTHTTRSR